MTDDHHERTLRVECDVCDWTLTREDIIDRLNANNERADERRIREKFGSLREGHAYFNRGHAPDYNREDNREDNQ